MRFYYIAVILAGIMLVLNMGGFETPSGSLVKSFNLINADGTVGIENFKNSGLWSNKLSTDSIPGITYILTAFAAVGIVLGIFGRQPDIRYLTAAMVLVLTGLLAADLIYLYSTISSFGVSWITSIMTCVLGAMIVGLFITAIQFWQGTD